MVVIANKMQSNCTASIMYNERKVGEGVAQLFLNNTGVKSAADAIFVLHDTVALNSNVYKNKSLHLILSLPPNEHISKEKLALVTSEFIEMAGYSNCPYLAYLHSDTDNTHVHIVSSTVDFTGQKIKEKDNYYKFFNIAREIEKNYGLEYLTPQTQKRVDFSLQENNMQKYSVQNAIRKAYKENKAGIIKALGGANVNALLQGHKSNIDLSSMLGVTLYGTVFDYLSKNKHFNSYYKAKLQSQIGQCLNGANTFDEFTNKMAAQNLYFSVLSSSSGNYIKYGSAENNFYCKCNSLAGRFRHDAIMAKFFGTSPSVSAKLTNSGKVTAKVLSKDKMKSIITGVMVGAQNIDHMKNLLLAYNIKLITHSNKRGIYGVSYGLLDNDTIYKGSELGKELSCNALLNYFALRNGNANNSNNVNSSELLHSNQNNIDIFASSNLDASQEQPFSEGNFGILPTITGGGGKSKKSSVDDEEFNKKHKRRR